VANSINNLASLYSLQGRYAEAEPMLLRALSMMEKYLGPDHPDVACTYSAALALIVGQPKPDAPALAAVYFNLAVLYQREGKHKKAKKMAEKAKSLRDSMASS